MTDLENLEAHPTNDPTNPLHRLGEDLQEGRIKDLAVSADVDYALHEIARLQASARRDAEEIERLRARFAELADDFERRADACHDLNKSDKEQRDRMRLHGKEAAYRHAMVLARAAHTGEG